MMDNNTRGGFASVWNTIPIGVRYGVLIVLGLILGALFFGGDTNAPSTHGHEEAPKEQVWTCSMHPTIQLPKPGQCPICAMDLIPVESGTDDAGLSETSMQLSDYAAALADIEVHPVERKFVTKEVELFGEVDYDETRIAYITAWVSGRIDRLYIDETGVPVRKGDHIAYLYSPELLSAQQEYVQALEGDEKVQETHLDIIRSSSKDTIKNAREKLINIGDTEQQIQSLEAEKKARENITIYSPASGIVLKREVQEGDYVKTGERLYAIADLAHVWIHLDAYESDIAWLRFGQNVTFTVEAYPGEQFEGRISFISPVLDTATRTVKVRVSVDNTQGRLKPGMFIRAIVKSDIAEGGQVVDAYMIDKWLCPMHPSEVTDTSGSCPICHMDLVSSETMGYTQPTTVTAPLVVKATAVLKTGKRAVVYVKDVQAQKPTFEGREITLGSRAGDYYIVLSGLVEGDHVVTEGNFKLDSALQIQAKPSMMSPKETLRDKATVEEEHTFTVAQEFLEQLTPLYTAYFMLQESLADDSLSGAQGALGAVAQAREGIDMHLLGHEAHMFWMEILAQINSGLAMAKGVTDIDGLREGAFHGIATALLSLERAFGHAGEALHYQTFCPMAMNNVGAAWLQRSEPVNNPFYGEMMLRCGETQHTFAARTTKKDGAHHGH